MNDIAKHSVKSLALAKFSKAEKLKVLKFWQESSKE